MKIETSNLKRYNKIFQQVKIAGNAYYDHVFLDFRKSLLSFYNTSSIVRINLNVSGESDREFLYVDGAKFFSLVGTYDSLELRDGKFISDKGDKFLLPSLEDDLDIPLEEDYSGEIHSLSFSESFLNDLDICKDFLDKNENFPALFFERDAIVALAQTKCIQAPSGLTDASFSIPYEVLRVILFLGIEKDETIEFRMKETTNGGKIIEFNYRDLFYRFSSSTDAQLPVDIYSEDFTSSFEHKEFFVLDSKELLKSIQTLCLFADVNSSHCKIEFVSENSLKIIVTTDSEIEYSQNILSMSDFEFFESKSFWISLLGLNTAVNSFVKKKASRIKIRFSDEAPTVKIFDEENSEEDMFIVQTLIEDPSL